MVDMVAGSVAIVSTKAWSKRLSPDNHFDRRVRKHNPSGKTIPFPEGLVFGRHQSPGDNHFDRRVRKVNPLKKTMSSAGGFDRTNKKRGSDRKGSLARKRSSRIACAEAMAGDDRLEVVAAVYRVPLWRGKEPPR